LFEYAEKGWSDAEAARVSGSKQPEGDSWERIGDRMHAAKVALQEASKLPTKCPHYYFVKQKLVRTPNSALLKEASAFEPTYYYYYRMQALLLHLDSEVDPDAAEKFADDVASQIGGDQGAIAYYEIAATLNGSAAAHAWPMAKLSWSKEQQGYAAMEKDYGTSVFKANQMAYLAVRAQDTETAKKLLAQVGDKWAPEVWGTKESFAYANAAAMMPAEIATLLQTATANQKTPEGQQYYKAVMDALKHNYGSALKDCLQLSIQHRESFDLLFEIGGDGNVQAVKAWPETKLGACLSPLLLSAKLVTPPKASFWLNIPFHLQDR
jgi:hypothetical protein